MTIKLGTSVSGNVGNFAGVTLELPETERPVRHGLSFWQGEPEEPNFAVLKFKLYVVCVIDKLPVVSIVPK